MAYRFLLEVPGTLVEDASIAVERTGDAQVVVVRTSHGLGYDDSMVDLTVAAHSLRVIDSLYGWFDSLGASRPDIRLVLHGGDRLSLEATDRGGMVAAIRRDQPWVERSLPRIGDHVIEDFAGPKQCQPPRRPAAAPRQRWRGRATRSRNSEKTGDHRARSQPCRHSSAGFGQGRTVLHRVLRDGAGGAITPGPGGTLVPLNGDYRWEDARAAGPRPTSRPCATAR